MVERSFEKVIRDFLSYFQVSVNDSDLSFFNTIPQVIFPGKKEAAKGLRNLILEISNPKNPENAVAQDQWTEYIQTQLINLDSNNVLKEIDKHLIDKVYFVGNEIGPIDILMYYLLYNTFLNLSLQEKEKSIHMSRWFNNVQHHANARQWRPIVLFSKCRLYT